MTEATDLRISETTIRALSERQAEPDWRLERRLKAWRICEAMAMPSGLEEEWRRTDIKALDLQAALQKAAASAAGMTVPVAGRLEVAHAGEGGLAVDPSAAERAGV